MSRFSLPLVAEADSSDATDRGHVGSAAEFEWQSLLNALPAAIYRTDAAGRITFFNEAAAALWGCRPELGASEFCGSWKLFWPDGSPLPHDECPMAIALKERCAIHGIEAVAERPDGTRVSFLAYPTPLFDEGGRLVGAVNMLVDLEALRQAENANRHYAAIVESSSDAIVSKDLNGIITSWNEGARRLFGYTAEEAISKPVTFLMPIDRHDEEPAILQRIRRGERIEHYETIRQRKDGSLVDISLTVSPIKDRRGKIVGASKIARDITERRRALEQRELLLREMNHRVKNLFAIASSVVSLSARTARTPKELATSVSERLAALARAHTLTLTRASSDAAETDQPVALHALIRAIISPFDNFLGNKSRATVFGPDIKLSRGAVTSLALLLHEFATNAAKYGALSSLDGTIEIDCTDDGENFALTWTERGGPPVGEAAEVEGFGGLLARTAINSQLGGEISREWRPEGLVIRVRAPRSRLSG
jgi:PAS domain S-box-containing protein